MPLSTKSSQIPRERCHDVAEPGQARSTTFQTVPVGGTSITLTTNVTNGDYRRPNSFEMRVTRHLVRHAHQRWGRAYKGSGQYIVGWDDRTNYAVQMLDADQAETLNYRWGASSDWAALNDRCLEKIFDRLKGDLNLAVDLAESAQALRMVRAQTALCRFTYDFLSKVVVPRRLRYGPSKAQQRLDYISGKWLEYKLGWYPLVSSIYGAMDELLREFETSTFTIDVSARRVREDNRYKANAVIDSTPYLGIASQPMTESTQLERRLRMRTRMSVTVRPPTPRSVYNWTSLDPAVIAWELVPFSFVADYCVNIGQTLELFEAYRQFRGLFVSGYKSESSRSDIDSRLQRYGYRTASWSSGTVYTNYKETNARHQRNVYHKRTVLTSFPSPSLTLRFEPRLGAQRQLTLAALFQQTVGKKLRVLAAVARKGRHRYTY